ncbi:MAG: response regulator, partial [Desulfuromonas sp.]
MSKKLLLADDSITIQKVIGITFANEDYELVSVDNGDAALQKATENRPDLILADVYMPGKNGYELCSAIKADPNLQTVPVLLLAGTFEPFDEEKARASGANDWISKPFESQALIDKVESLLSQPAVAPQPVAPPAVEAAPAAPAAPPEPATAASEGGGDIWDDMADDDIFAEEAPAVEPAPQEADDELWGALEEEDLAEVPVETTSASDEDDLWGALDEEMAEPAIAVEEDDFDFAEEPAAVEPTAAAPEPMSVPLPTETPVVQGSDEDILSLDEDDILAEEDIELIDEPAEIGTDDFEFDDNKVEDVSSAGDFGDLSTAEQPPVASAGDELDWGDLAEPTEMAEMYDSFEDELTPPEMSAPAPEPAAAPAPAPEPAAAPAPAPEPAAA